MPRKRHSRPRANHIVQRNIPHLDVVDAPIAPEADVPAPRLADVPATGLLLVGVGVHLFFLLSLRFGWLNPLFDDTMHRFGPGADFFSIYAAGVKARAGESVYTIGGHMGAVPYAYAFRYAPLVAYTLGAALSCLPAVAAYAAWLIACELALLRNIRLTLEAAPNRRTGQIAAALWLLFTPYYLELFVGQFTFITASLVFWAYLGWRGRTSGAGREAGVFSWADTAWGVAVCLKMMPLLYLPIVLLRGRWRAALVVVLILAVSSTLYFARFPQDWAVFAATNASDAPAGHAGNLGLMAFLYHATSERQQPFLIARVITLLLTGTALAWLTYRVWQALPGESLLRQFPLRQSRLKQSLLGQLIFRWNADRPALDGEDRLDDRLLALYAACSAAYLLTYKDVWEHHYVLLLPPLVLLALRRYSPWLWLPPFLVSALPGLFVLYDLPDLGYNEDPQAYWRPATSLLHHASKILAPLWLLAGLLTQSLASRASNIPVLRRDTSNLSRRRGRITLAKITMASLLGLAFLGGALWTRTVIIRQKQTTRELVWSPQVFRKQETAWTCGPAALAAVCRHYRVPASEAEIARLAGTTRQGTSMLGLQAAARAKGLTAEGMRTTLGELPHVPRPCILFFHPGHFAVLTGVRDVAGKRSLQLYLADPALGQRTITLEQLSPVWHGELLVVGPGGLHTSDSAP